ncbi:hypothetical protein J6590_050197 [Homalodisca vitripennis]|nr:hypothetical protein J6590_050197 [Homalodisca vitripennis]
MMKCSLILLALVVGVVYAAPSFVDLGTATGAAGRVGSVAGGVAPSGLDGVGGGATGGAGGIVPQPVKGAVGTVRSVLPQPVPIP